MSYSPKIKAAKPLAPKALRKALGQAEIDVDLESGPSARILVQTPGQVVKDFEKGKKAFQFGRPALFVSRLDEANVKQALSAMAEELSGYWLRLYDR